jgi:hypothetical protein
VYALIDCDQRQSLPRTAVVTREKSKHSMRQGELWQRTIAVAREREKGKDTMRQGQSPQRTMVVTREKGKNGNQVPKSH